MKFRFGLEVVLKHRQRLEDEAQREFAEAQHAVDVILKHLESMYQRLDEVRDEILQMQKTGAADQVEQIREMETFVHGHKIRIEDVRMKVRALMEVAEEKQEALILAAQEKKALVKLKDKRKTEHMMEMNRQETKELDDLAMIRQSWRKG